MRIKKTITVGINLNDPIGVYADPEILMRILAKQFEGRCIRGCFVVKIEKIIRVSDCMINHNGPPDFGTVSVICEVTAIEYANGEIINGCKVIKQDSRGIIFCRSGNTSVMINQHPDLRSIKAGQYISVEVRGVKYVIDAEEISVNAVPYLPRTRAVVYKIGPMSDANRAELANVMERIEFEEAEAKSIKENNPDAWATFNKLLYAYKEEQKPPKGAKVITLKDLANNNAVIYVSRDPALYMSKPEVCVFADAKAARTNIPTKSVVLSMFEDYCAHLRTIREMINVYSTEKLIEEHSNVWRIYRNNKMEKPSADQ